MKGMTRWQKIVRRALLAVVPAAVLAVGAVSAVQAAPLADLTVSISTLRLSTNGDDVMRSFDLNVRNQGQAPASNVRVTLRVPRNLRYLGFSAPAGVTCSYITLLDGGSPGYVTCSGLSVAAGATGRITVRFEQPPITSPTNVTVSATVDPANATFESNESNNTGSLTFRMF